MKRMTAALICILLLTAMICPVFAAGSATMNVSGSKSSAYRGDTIDFTVTISAVENCRSAAFMLTYDTSVFEFVSGKCTLSGTALASFSGGTGTFAFAEGATVSGKIFTFTLRVKSDAAVGSSTISANVNTRDGNGAIPTSVNSLTINIKCDHSFGPWSKADDANHQHTCTNCGTIEKNAHAWNKGTVTKEPTCKESGEKTYTCADCGATKAETVAKTDNHSFGAWAKVDGTNHQHTCTVCGKEESTAHAWNSGTVTKAPTCKETGEKTLTCTACCHTKTESVAKTNEHSYGAWIKVDDATHKHSCTTCGKEETAAHTWDTGKVTKQSDCKKEGAITYTCSGCSHTKSETMPVTTNHTYGRWERMDENSHKHICSVCSKEESAAHTWNKGVVTKKPTCMTEGEKTYTCTGCGFTKSEVVPKSTTHTYDHGCDPDCSICGQTRSITHKYDSGWSKDQSKHWHQCSVCGEKKDSASHTPGPEATETSAQTCTVCEHVIAPARNHDHHYADTWTVDETNHWYACAGCDEPENLANHDFENACDPDCSVCGLVRLTSHSYCEEWACDSENHWNTCVVCGETSDLDPHTPGAEATADTAQTCLICGYEIVPALGQPTDDPIHVESEFPWWIIIAGALCGIAVAVIVISRKKRT